MNIIAAIENTIPISQFNRGLAGKIFADVRQSGAKVVMKNNAPECVLLSPQEYIRIMDALNDAKLLAVAAERMEHYESDTVISAEEVQKNLGISDKDISDFEDVEFE